MSPRPDSPAPQCGAWQQVGEASLAAGEAAPARTGAVAEEAKQLRGRGKKGVLVPAWATLSAPRPLPEPVSPSIKWEQPNFRQGYREGRGARFSDPRTVPGPDPTLCTREPFVLFFWKEQLPQATPRTLGRTQDASDRRIFVTGSVPMPCGSRLLTLPCLRGGGGGACLFIPLRILRTRQAAGHGTGTP